MDETDVYVDVHKRYCGIWNPLFNLAVNLPSHIMNVECIDLFSEFVWLLQQLLLLWLELHLIGG